MNNENEDLENVKLVEGVKEIIGENQYFGGKESNKRTVLRIKYLFDDFNIDVVKRPPSTENPGGKS